MSRSEPGSEPTPQELAAIVAAVELVWPRPVVEPPPTRSPWRFSGRWWQPSGPVAASRRRPT
jgi:hypothetical protein